MVKELSKVYVYKNVSISKIDTDIFSILYFGNCMENKECNDICCSYGCDVDYAQAYIICKIMGIDYKKITETAHDVEYPSCICARFGEEDGKCIMRNDSSRGRKIHTWSLEGNVNYHHLKPMICCLFPITYDNSLLRPMDEVIEKELFCLGSGVSLYDGVREDLKYYFGEELVNELDKLK